MINKITVNQLKDELSSNNLILIDCREQGEWDESHIKEAKFIPLSNFEEKTNEILSNMDKNSKIVCQCRSGKRSMKACKLLEEKGFTNLYNLEGGILKWVESGFPTE